MKTGTLRKEQEDWYVVYFVTAEGFDPVARVEIRLAEEDHEQAVEGDRVQFDTVKVNGKTFAKIQDSTVGSRQINQHLKYVILG